MWRWPSLLWRRTVNGGWGDPHPVLICTFTFPLKVSIVMTSQNFRRCSSFLLPTSHLRLEFCVMGFLTKVSLPFLGLLIALQVRPPEVGPPSCSPHWPFSLIGATGSQGSGAPVGLRLHGTAFCSTGQLLGFLPAPHRRLPVRGLTCALWLSLCRTHPPAPGNAAAPERLEALKYQRIKKPKKSSKGSSKSKKRSGKWREAPRSSLSPLPAMITGLFASGPPTWGCL